MPHSVMTFPNYVVIGVPGRRGGRGDGAGAAAGPATPDARDARLQVLSSMFKPAMVKVYMGLLLMVRAAGRRIMCLILMFLV